MFNKGTKIHLVGIKGVGMTALAAILQSRGCVVTGSDTSEEFFTDAVLKRFKIPVAQGFGKENIKSDVSIVISSVVYFFKGRALNNNADVKEALWRKLVVMTYPQAIGQLAPEYKIIAVAGSHGKSTTTAMLGWVLEQTGLDPTVMVGTEVKKWKSNARVGKSEYLVVEADEYREAFLNYQPFGAIITSVDYDHPDYFKSRSSYEAAFRHLIDNIDQKGWLVASGGDPIMRRLLSYSKKQRVKTISYGFSKSNDVQVSDWGIQSGKQLFHITFQNQKLFAGKQFGFKRDQEWRASSGFPGQQYILNSGAAFIAALQLGAEPKKVIKALANFPGTTRRLEVIQTKPGIVIDDYAHHPTAIRVTLNGIRRMYPDRKLVVVFQPHMYSRTATFLDPFARSFSDADVVGITGIFSSARETAGPVSGKDLAIRTKKYHHNVTYVQNVSRGKQFVKRFTRPGNVVVLMGAGDIYKLAHA
ncbi:MAG: UDP-N-acetylmuramate--L-alanine ligase [bacterium]|nr:UDP-N-acetylmuramate--L-alanine ligase [bacterium]